MTTTMFGMLRAGAAIVFVLAMAGLADADGNTLSADGLQSAAHQGNAEAQYWLGWTYRFGEFARDDTEAARWYRVAAEQGFALAQTALGDMYRRGEGVEPDAAEAARWYRLAAEQYARAAEEGDARSQYRLAWMYLRGEGVEQDDAKAASWFRDAAEQGDEKSQFWLGMLYRGGEGVEKDHAEAARWLHAAAEQGDTQSQWYLGQWYRDGEGVPADYVTAYAWLNIAAASALGSAERDELAEQMTAGQIAAAQRMARELSERIDAGTDKTRAEAETGDADAQYWLGWTYRFGQVERNDVEAARWYRAAAEQGHAHAQFTLSAMHVAGEGVPKDVSEAVRWYRLAAEQSEASPWMQLAIMYAIGYEVEPDHTEAARWFREGIAISHHKRGRMLHSRGDYVDAARWLRAAAQQGETQSQWYLGRMYREGEGVPADYVTSYAWLDVASQDRANIPALERDHLATRMTTRQIADARRMARELRERIEADSR